MALRWSLILAFVLGAAILGGCSDDDDDGGGAPTPTTAFTGFFSNGTENGSLGIMVHSTSLARPIGTHLVDPAGRDPVAPLAVVTAMGTLKLIGGGTIDLTGIYDDQADSLALSNPTAGYTFIGEYDTTGAFDAILGEYDGPGATGFFGCITGPTATASYCGTFDSDSTKTGGPWDILIAGDWVGGIAFPSSGDPFAFEGTIETTGTTRDFTAGDSDPGVYTLTVTGTLDTTTSTVSGTWTYEDLKASSIDAGTWSGSVCP